MKLIITRTRSWGDDVRTELVGTKKEAITLARDVLYDAYAHCTAMDDLDEAIEGLNSKSAVTNYGDFAFQIR